MKKLFLLMLCLSLGVAGFIYFNPSYIFSFKVDEINVYNYDNYKSNTNNKTLTPLIVLNKKSSINTIVNTINSIEKIDSVFNIKNPNYVINTIYSKGNKDTFYLWINDNSNSAILVNSRDIKTGYIVPKEDTNKLKTLIFR